jgi:hypothetical protein
MELGKLTQAQKIAGAAGLVLLVSLWFSWYGVDVGGGVAESIVEDAGIDTSANAWQSFDIIDLLLFLTALAAIAFAALAAAGRRVDLPVEPAQVVAGLGALSVLAILYRIINQPGPNDAIGLKFGVFLGLLAALGVAYAGWRAMQEGPLAAHGAPAAGRETASRATPPASAPTESAPAAQPPAAPPQAAPPEAPPAAAPPAAAPPAAAPPVEPPPAAEPPATPTTPPPGDTRPIP